MSASRNMLSEGEPCNIQIEPQTNPQIQNATVYLLTNEKYLINHHYYSRFIADETELWMFGCGLGEQSIMEQFGAAFLDYCVKHDPALGKIMLGMGHSATSFYTYKGNINIWYAWADRPNRTYEYLAKTLVKPQLLLCPSHPMKKEADDLGLENIYLPFATGNDYKPLGYERKGLGYAGSPIKPKEQYHILLEPFINDGFEWVSKTRDDPFLTSTQLNEWYNHKQIVFGMIEGHCKQMHLVPNRMFETLASGTPFITGRYDLEDTFSFMYPYMTDSQDETIELVAEILCSFPETLAKFAEYSKEIRKNHNWDVRVKTLMEHLKK